MDVTDRASIAAARDTIASKEGKLHILVNKWVPLPSLSGRRLNSMRSAGQVGPVSAWFEDPSAPQRQSAEAIGSGFFEGESFEEWSQLYSINTFSIFFVTTALLGLLAKGSEDVPGYTSSVVNITSVSGRIKLSQNHVCFFNSLLLILIELAPQFAYNSAKAAATHLSKMLATEFALKNVPVRVSSIAPGVWESEITYDRITPELVDKVGKGLVPVPARRPGS